MTVHETLSCLVGSNVFLKAGRAPAKNIALAMCSADDVINSMTSLLLPYSAQKMGGSADPPALQVRGQTGAVCALMLRVYCC